MLKNEIQTKRIKIYDFSRPDKFSREQICDFSKIMKSVSQAISNFSSAEYDIPVKIDVQIIDQLTFEEFIRSIPKPSPCCFFECNKGYGIFQMDSKVFFSGFMDSGEDKKRELNVFEQKIFFDYLYKPFEKILFVQFGKIAEIKLELPKKHKISNNPKVYLEDGKNYSDMGILVSFEIDFKNTQSTINLFFSADMLEYIEEAKHPSKNEKLIPFLRSVQNTIAEIGRFRLEENFKLESNLVFELKTESNELLNIYKNGNLVGQGEAVVIEDNLGVQLTTNTEKIEIPTDNDFYNTKVLFGGCTTSSSQKFEENMFIKFDEYWNEPFKIVKDEKIIAYGEIVVIDFIKYTVKIKKVFA